MALQRSGVNIPVSFEFAPKPREWFICSTEVLGWHVKVSEQRRQEHLARVRAIGGLAAVAAIPEIPLLATSAPAMDRPFYRFVVIRIHLTEMARAAGLQDVYELTVPGEDVPNLLAGWTPENVPELQLRRFPMLVSPAPPNLTTTKVPLIDPRIMRKEFFGLQSGDNLQLAAFLSRWGRWGGEQQLREEGAPLALGQLNDQTIALNPQNVWSLHSAARSGAAGSPKQWFTQTLPNKVGVVAASLFAGAAVRLTNPYFVVRHELCRDAIVDAITIDQLRGIRHRFCQNKRCGKLYEKVNNHTSKFCSAKCGTYLRVRKHRRKQNT
jgi:hypothetical protein